MDGEVPFDALARVMRIGDDGDPAQSRKDVLQNFQTLEVELGDHERRARHVRARFGKAHCKAGGDRISAGQVDNRNSNPKPMQNGNGNALRDNDAYARAFELSRKVRNLLRIILSEPEEHLDRLTLDIAERLEGRAKGREIRPKARFALSRNLADQRNTVRPGPTEPGQRRRPQNAHYETASQHLAIKVSDPFVNLRDISP